MATNSTATTTSQIWLNAQCRSCGAMSPIVAKEPIRSPRPSSSRSTAPSRGPLGIDLGGATIISQITNGAPVIDDRRRPGVDLRYLTLCNFTIQGNGAKGDGIKIVADGNDRWVYNWNIQT